MRTAYIRNKLYIHWPKIIAVIAVIFFFQSMVHAQSVTKLKRTHWVKRNNPNYDQKKLTYGFLIGLHSSAYQIKYSDKFVSHAFDTVHSVESEWRPGFSLGFIVNYRIAELWDIRMTPLVAFYEQKLRYTFTDKTPTDEQLVETTMVEFPILVKFKSERRENTRMYMIGGIKPGIEASGKGRVQNVTTTLEVKNFNLSLDVGFGFDIYYPLFKFSPEIRFSRGLVNVLDNTTNKYGQPLQRVNTNMITVYLLFQ